MIDLIVCTTKDFDYNQLITMNIISEITTILKCS